MRVLITGGAGFLGSHLVEHYLSEGHEVISVDHLGSGSNMIEGAEFIKHDIAKPLDVECDLILHFASRASPPDYQAHPLDTIHANSLGTFNLLKLAQKNKARFVFASTSEIYGSPPKEAIPTPESYWGFVNSCGPRSCYDESKRLGETYCYEFFRKGVDVRMVRIFNTYGPRMRIDDGRVVTNFINQALKGKELTIYGDGSQARSYCYVSDLINGIVLVTSAELGNDNFKTDRVFNVGNPDEHHTVNEMALLIKELTNSSSKIIHQGLPTDDPDDRVPDITKLRSLGWEPKIPLGSGLNKTVEYFRGLL